MTAHPRSDVAVPQHIAGDVLAALSFWMTHQAREYGKRPTPDAARLLVDLHAAAQRHRAGHQPAAAGPEPAVEGDGAGQALSVAETAARMGCSPQWVRALLAAGRLPGRKIGGRWLVTVHAGHLLAETQVPQGSRAMLSA